MLLIPDGPFKGLRPKHYRAILCDCPWKYLTWSAKGLGKSPDRHYNTMTIPELMALPVQQVAHRDCVLYFWVIDSHAELAFKVISAWGFKYKTIGFYWAKTNKDGSWFMNTGHWTRANPEHAYECYFGETEEEVERCFLNTVGKPKRVRKDVRRLIVAERREHSRKPDDIHNRIEALTDGPYLEMFGRRTRPGWSIWGDEAQKFDDPEIYPDLVGLI